MRLLGLLLIAACSHTEPVAAPAAGPPPPLGRAERQALRRQGNALFDRKAYAACAAPFERAERWYSAATCHALAGQADAAFADLARASIHDLDAVVVDTDLAPLHGDPRWPGLLDSVAQRVAAYVKTVNGELWQLYVDDQSDRALPFDQMDWKVIQPRDVARRKRVDEILAAGGARAGDDYYHAAMVYQHGDTQADIQRAHDLAVEAVQRDPGNETARWLAAAALDRALMYAHQPQKYGTQFKKVDGVWILWEVDPAVTDAERDTWNVPPIAQARAHAAAMNQPN